MLNALKNLPVMFAQAGGGKDRIFACVRMAVDAKSVEVWCADSNDISYRNTFDEAAMTPLKDYLSWDAFFKGIEEGFNARKVQVTPDAAATGLTLECLVGADSKKVQFVLPRVKDSGGSLQMLRALQDFYWTREDDTYQLDFVAHLEKDATDSERARDVVMKEMSEMRAVLANAENIATASKNRLEALEKEVVALETARAASMKKAALSIEERIGLQLVPDDQKQESYARLPLTDARGNLKLHIDYDAKLLQLIKGKFTPAADGEDLTADKNAHKLIKPLTNSQYQQELAALSDPGRKIVMDALVKIDEWDFNVFDIQNFSHGHSLFIVAYALFMRYNVFQRFNLDERHVINFLSQVEAGYQPNPYHCSTHAADVLHVTHFIITKGGLSTTARLTKEDEFAGLIAACIHDYDHPGINNNFHQKTQSYLARLYSDRSILENHHTAEVFEMMKDPRFDLLSAMSAEQRKDIRDTVTDMILATDMGLHAKILQSFKRRLQEEKDACEKTQSTSMLTRKDDQRLALSMAIKMADISNCGRPEHLYLTWSSKIADEFFLQGDRERNLGLAVSPFMDRATPAMSRGQMAFMNYIVIPLFETISEFLPEMHFSVEMVESNRTYWANHDDSTI